MSKSLVLNDYNFWDSRGITHNRQLLSEYLSQVSTNLTNIKIDRLWSGNLPVGSTVTIPTYANYDMLFFLVQTAWNRNGYIIVSKWQYGQEKNFEIDLYSEDGVGNYYLNPARFPNVDFGGSVSSGRLTEIVGIKLGGKLTKLFFKLMEVLYNVSIN